MLLLLFFIIVFVAFAISNRKLKRKRYLPRLLPDHRLHCMVANMLPSHTHTFFDVNYFCFFELDKFVTVCGFIGVHNCCRYYWSTRVFIHNTLSVPIIAKNMRKYHMAFSAHDSVETKP